MGPEGAKILIVDDDEPLREAIGSDVRKRGYQVSLATGGHAAFAQLLKEPVDLVLSDFRMPDGDGLDLLKRLRELDSERPAFFLVSGYSDLTLEEAYAKGADAVFGKPYDRADFFARIAWILKPLQERYHPAEGQALPARSIEFIEPSLGEAALSGRLLLGRGGFYAALPRPAHPKTGDSLRFGIRFASEPWLHLQGTAQQRWCRPEGCGFQFQSLDESSCLALREYLRRKPTPATIPIGP